MNLLNAERIKFFSIHTPRWCIAAAFALVLALGWGFTAAAVQTDQPVTIAVGQAGRTTGMMAIMIMAATFVASEYRFGVINATLLAAPTRRTVVITKAVVAGTAAGLVGLGAAFGAWLLSALLAPGSIVPLQGEPAWRALAGTGLVYLVAAIIGVAVAFLVRNTAAALVILVLWPVVVDQLVGAVPVIGPAIRPWMPFVAADHFLTLGHPRLDGSIIDPGSVPYTPWSALLYAAVFALTLLIIAMVVVRRRDA